MLMKNEEDSEERGFALIIAVLLVAVIAGIGTTLILRAMDDTRTNANYRTGTQAFYVAKSGLEEARSRIPALSTNPLTLPATASAVTYIVADATVQPANPANAYYDSEYAAEFAGVTPTISTVTSIQNSGTALPYKWVRVTVKTEASSSQDIDRNSVLDSATPVYYDGSSQNLTASGSPVYKITALAVLPGGSRSVLQMEGSEPPPFSATAAVGSQDDVKLQGSFSVNGIDYCGLSSTVYALESTQEVNISGNSGTLAGSTGPSPNTTGTYQNSPTPYDITSLINSLKPYATPIQQVDSTVGYNSNTNTYSGTSVHLGTPPLAPPAPGATGTPVITYAGGNLTLTANGSQGDGILIVDGDLNINGGLYYYGLIIVRGIISFTGGGSGAVNIYGSIASGSSVMNNSNLGGGVNVQYDSCAVKNPYKSLPLKVLAFREIYNY